MCARLVQSRRRIDTRIRLWLILFAIAFFGAFLAFAAAAPARMVASNPHVLVRPWTDAILPLIDPLPFARTHDSWLFDCLSLAVFGIGLVMVGALLRRGAADPKRGPVVQPAAIARPTDAETPEAMAA